MPAQSKMQRSLGFPPGIPLDSYALYSDLYCDLVKMKLPWVVHATWQTILKRFPALEVAAQRFEDLQERAGLLEHLRKDEGFGLSLLQGIREFVALVKHTVLLPDVLGIRPLLRRSMPGIIRLFSTLTHTAEDLLPPENIMNTHKAETEGNIEADKENETEKKGTKGTEGTNTDPKTAETGMSTATVQERREKWDPLGSAWREFWGGGVKEGEGNLEGEDEVLWGGEAEAWAVHRKAWEAYARVVPSILDDDASLAWVRGATWIADVTGAKEVEMKCGLSFMQQRAIGLHEPTEMGLLMGVVGHPMFHSYADFVSMVESPELELIMMGDVRSFWYQYCQQVAEDSLLRDRRESQEECNLMGYETIATYERMNENWKALIEFFPERAQCRGVCKRTTEKGILHLDLNHLTPNFNQLTPGEVDSFLDVVERHVERLRVTDIYTLGMKMEVSGLFLNAANFLPEYSGSVAKFEMDEGEFVEYPCSGDEEYLRVVALMMSREGLDLSDEDIQPEWLLGKTGDPSKFNRARLRENENDGEGKANGDGENVRDGGAGGEDEGGKESRQYYEAMWAKAIFESKVIEKLCRQQDDAQRGIFPEDAGEGGSGYDDDGWPYEFYIYQAPIRNIRKGAYAEDFYKEQGLPLPSSQTVEMRRMPRRFERPPDADAELEENPFNWCSLYAYLINYTDGPRLQTETYFEKRPVAAKILRYFPNAGQMVEKSLRRADREKRQAEENQADEEENGGGEGEKPGKEKQCTRREGGKREFCGVRPDTYSLDEWLRNIPSEAECKRQIAEFWSQYDVKKLTTGSPEEQEPMERGPGDPIYDATQRILSHDPAHKELQSECAKAIQYFRYLDIYREAGWRAPGRGEGKKIGVSSDELNKMTRAQMAEQVATLEIFKELEVLMTTPHEIARRSVGYTERVCMEMLDEWKEKGALASDDGEDTDDLCEDWLADPREKKSAVNVLLPHSFYPDTAECERVKKKTLKIAREGMLEAVAKMQKKAGWKTKQEERALGLSDSESDDDNRSPLPPHMRGVYWVPGSPSPAPSASASSLWSGDSKRQGGGDGGGYWVALVREVRWVEGKACLWDGSSAASSLSEVDGESMGEGVVSLSSGDESEGGSERGMEVGDESAVEEESEKGAEGRDQSEGENGDLDINSDSSDDDDDDGRGRVQAERHWKGMNSCPFSEDSSRSLKRGIVDCRGGSVGKIEPQGDDETENGDPKFPPHLLADLDRKVSDRSRKDDCERERAQDANPDDPSSGRMSESDEDDDGDGEESAGGSEESREKLQTLSVEAGESWVGLRFSESRYGYQGAYELAVSARRRWETQLIEAVEGGKDESYFRALVSLDGFEPEVGDLWWGEGSLDVVVTDREEGGEKKEDKSGERETPTSPRPKVRRCRRFLQMRKRRKGRGKRSEDEEESEEPSSLGFLSDSSQEASLLESEGSSEGSEEDTDFIDDSLVRGRRGRRKRKGKRGSRRRGKSPSAAPQPLSPATYQKIQEARERGKVHISKVQQEGNPGTRSEENRPVTVEPATASQLNVGCSSSSSSSSSSAVGDAVPEGADEAGGGGEDRGGEGEGREVAGGTAVGSASGTAGAAGSRAGLVGTAERGVGREGTSGGGRRGRGGRRRGVPATVIRECEHKSGVVGVVYGSVGGGCWRANWRMSGKRLFKNFFVAEFGYDGALRRAIAHRQQMEREGKASMQKPTEFQSGVKGVNWDKSNERWMCNWHEGGKQILRSFKKSEFGFEEAKNQAIAMRLQKERELYRFE